MKHLLFVIWILILLLFCGSAQAASVIADQKTVAWDAVTTNTDGEALPEGSDIRYKVFLMNSQTLDVTEVTTDPVTETQYLITFTQEGNFFFGVQAVRYIDGSPASYSSIAWSNDPAVCLDGDTSDITHYRPPAGATGLRIP